MISAVATIQHTPDPALLIRSGSVLEELLTEAPSDVLVQMAPMREVGEVGTALLASPRMVLAPGQATALGTAFDAGRLRVTSIGEALAPGQATPATLAALSRTTTYPEASVWAAGTIVFGNSGPKWAWQSGHFLEPVQLDVGALRIPFSPGRSLGTEIAALVGVRAALGAGELASAGAAHNPAGDLLVTTLQESDQGTVRRDLPVDVVVFGPPARDSSLIVHSVGGVRFDGGQPKWAWRDGSLVDVDLLSEGRLRATLLAGRGIGELSSVLLATPHGALSGSKLRGVAIEHVSPTELRLSLLDVADAGEGSSKLSNFDFDLAVIASGAR